MSEELTVYAYNVLFGDGILVEVPDGGRKRFILIDVGNVLSGPGGENKALLDAVDDIMARTGNRIDLYIMTHEHLDHVQGLLYAKNQGRKLKIDTVWMTASAEPDYYQKHPQAREKRQALFGAVDAFRAVLAASGLPTCLMAAMEINHSSKTADCVEHIRKTGSQVYYLHRESTLEGRHPFTEAQVRVLAPEEDTSLYYDSPVRAHLDLPSGEVAAASARPLPLRGVDGGAFYELIDGMDQGLAESLFAIDRAANNTSLVVELSWRGRRLLFAGDAERESWRMMAAEADLRPVELLKVGHHGSHNATPSPDILDHVLPAARRREAAAVLSTCPDVYEGVPHPGVLSALEARTSRVYRTTDAPPGTPVAVSLAPGG